MGTKKMKREKEKNTQKEKNMHKEKSVPSLCSRLFFCWLIPIFFAGNRRDLEEEDMSPARKIYGSKRSGDILERKWFEEETAARSAGRQPSFTKAMAKAFIWSYIPGGIMAGISVMLRTFSPLLFAELLGYWSVDSTMTVQTAGYYAIGMIGMNWLSAFFNHHGFLYNVQFGMKMRVATSTLMFRKIMRMSNSSLGETAAGKVVNILSNDLQRFDMVFFFLHYSWIIPLQLAAVFYLGYMQAGLSALIGLVALIIIAIPIQGTLGKVNGKVRFRTALKTDDRIKIMSEVINGMQVIKMYAWEIPFQKVVGQKRMDELKEIRIASILRMMFLGFMMFTERTAIFITILTLILTGNQMSASVIYPLQQFMSAAQVNITLMLPVMLSFTAELLVTMKRVQEFMCLDDRADLAAYIASSQPQLKISSSFKEKESLSVRPLSYHRTSETTVTGFRPLQKFPRSISHHDDIVVEVRDVTASWTADPDMLALKNVSFRIRRGKLCAIIGAVGSGKSSILQLLLKELTASSGTVSVNGSLSYAAQESWLFPSTVRENILFGLPYDTDKYKRVCKVCALEKDFKQFPYGDQTLVGERGVSLSGGQRARINLARSVYREADIYLLDDPLSAVDANVGRQLFEGCINGYLRGRTRILVTHQIHFLKAADYIIVLNEGRIENMGTFDQLASSGKDFAMMLTALQEGRNNDSASVSSGAEKRPSLIHSVSTTSDAEDQPEFEAQKMDAEERQSGNLKWDVVGDYFLSGGNVCFVIFTIFIILMTAASAAGVDYWVSYWSNQMALYEEGLDGAEIESGLDVQIGPFTVAQYLIIHGSIVGATILLTHIRIIPFVSLCVTASKNLHNRMFSTMLRGIMRFFDTSSSGRILNRFTKDMGAIDEILPRSLLDVFQIYCTLATILVLNALALYWTMIPSVVLILVFCLFVRIYMKAAQGIKRLEGTAKSPVFGMVTSSLNGISTIRSCGAEVRLAEQFDEYQDLHTRAWNGYIGGGSMFGFYLDTICLIYLAIIIFVFLYIDLGITIPVGSIALAVTQSNTLTVMLQHGAKMLVEFLAQLTSVERVLEYTKIETEENLFEGQIETSPTWPSEGQVVFKNVYLRYAPEEPPVLKNLNIRIESGWKVGIVGRTGAGKSSLISALFRFSYIDGLISVDDIDTSLVSRQTLRSKISIIPQEPVLFSATVRYNLDPFDIYSDDDLWRALEQVDMKGAIPSLDFKVTEAGANFSVGQRQLICLARAILRSNKILIMDEATANVDPQTDNFIQQTIRRQFATCTVLTIAHRLNTIMDSDRVLVMSTGEVVEFDHPHILLSDPNSMFSSMVNETGEKSSQQLFEVAKEAYFQSNLKENVR